MTQPLRVNARLDRARAKKLEALKRRTGLSTTEVICAALDAQYEAMKEHTNPADAFDRGGLIGCGDGPADLSTNRRYLDASLGDKVSRE